MARTSVLEEVLARTLATRLLQLREQRQLTQERVAELAGLSRNHYQLLEAGLSDRAKSTPANPRLSTLVDLARALNCTLEELLSDLPRVA